ncbi:MAG TPA: response regulator transcription factor [Nitrospira sp.]|nr:response regulator transcription factor [Nitrospira sp.]
MAIAELIRVLLVDDHVMLRQELKSVLTTYPNIDIAGEAGDGEAAIRMAAQLQPAVIIMDINLPKIDGIAATRFIKTTYPDIAVIGLSLHVQSYSEYAMRRAGAFEVLVKEKAVHELYGAIQRAVASLKPILILQDHPISQDTAISSDEGALGAPDALAEDADTPQSSTPPTAC